MKYGSGMTHFHENIVAALRHMLGNNSEITEKFSPNDGSPAPLRDYLKEEYGKSYTSHVGNGMRYSCKASTGFELAFDTIILNGDRNLTLSWSQVAKFIRDNWDEVFKKDNPKTDSIEVSAEKQPSYLDKLREKYPKVDVNDAWFDYCPAELFDDDNVPSVSDGCPRNPDNKLILSCEKCWSLPCSKIITFYDNLELFEENYFEHYPEEATAEAAEADTVPEISEEKSETDKSNPTYKDIFLEHYPDFDVGQFDEFIFDACLSEFFDDRGSTKCPEHHDCKICWYSECKHKWDITEEGENDIKPYRKVPPVPDDTERDKPTENQIATTAETALQGAFDYSELDSDTADKLRAVSERVISIKTTYIIETAKQVKAAHDLLANHYKGLWGAWCKSVGFSRDTGDNLVRVAKVFPEFDVAENFGNIEQSLLYAASKPSAPPELVKQVKNGDITTHKDYIKLKAELDRTREECRQLDANSAAKDKEYKRQLEEANKRAETAEQSNEKNAAKLAAEAAKTDELLLQIKELENRPTDVAVQRDEASLAEIARLKNELAKAQQDVIDASFGSSASGNSELVSEFYETLHGSALSAIRSCADFAEKNGSKFIGRFRSLAEVINDYINELEE